MLDPSPVASKSFVILDTNYLYGAKPPELEALRARGLRISVSSIAIVEAGARSFRESNMQRMTAPIARAFPYVDAERPIAPFNGEAVKAIRARMRGEQPPPGDVSEHALEWWNALGTGSIGRRQWERIAWLSAELRLKLDQEWSRLCARFDGEVARAWRASGADERGVWAYLATTLEFEEALADRLDAWLRLMARRLVRVGLGEQTRGKNDSRDNRLLHHLGEGSILLTRDLRLIKAVDEVGTHQAPWVRTLPDILELPLPTGPPWGHGARDEAARFQRTGRA